MARQTAIRNLFTLIGSSEDVCTRK
uniref:Uncharacterized protein n=1 Tax=Arundo donax TaxID=35708 RepID=A0A0A8XZ24_ARUDO